MKIIKLKTLGLAVVLCCAAAWLAPAHAQTMQVGAKLDADSIKLGDQTRFHLTLTVPVNTAKISFPVLTDTLAGKVQIVSEGKPDTIIDKNNPNTLTIRHNYTITSFDAGSYVIPSYTITSAAGSMKTPEQVLRVTPVAVDTTKGVYDIKQPIAVKYTWADWLRDNWLWIAIPMLVIVLTAAGVFWWLLRPKKQAEAKPKVILPPHVLAMQQLNQLRDKKLWQQSQTKAYYSELTDILRAYVEGRYQVPALELTTAELLDSLKRVQLTTADAVVLAEVLQLADLVKFAKANPIPAENELSLLNAVAFVERTSPIAPPTDNADDLKNNDTHEPA